MNPTYSVPVLGVCLLFMGSVACVAVADEPRQDAFTAGQLLDRMAKAYAGSKSYRDSGSVKTVFIQADGNFTVEKPFTTAFIRPDRFRFEYKETMPNNQQYRYVIWRRGKDVRTWWDVQPGIGRPESLNVALGAAKGVSGRSAHSIPALLLPEEIKGLRLTDVTEGKRIDDAKFGDVDCFRVKGKFTGSPIIVWIDKKTSLVRRIDAENKFDNFRTEETTTFDPAIGGEITDNSLEFDPPHQKR